MKILYVTMNLFIFLMNIVLICIKLYYNKYILFFILSDTQLKIKQNHKYFVT